MCSISHNNISLYARWQPLASGHALFSSIETHIVTHWVLQLSWAFAYNGHVLPTKMIAN